MRPPDVPYGATISARTILRAAGGLTTLGAAVAAIPIVEGVILWRSARPPVPGPHHQDGFVDEASAGTPLSIVWLGDSLASGIGAGCADSSFPRRAASLVGAEGRNVHLTCLAKPGSRSCDVLADQIPLARERLGAGDVAIVTVGSNDVGTFTLPWIFSRRYTQIIDALTATGATVVAVGLPNMGAATVMPQPLRSIVGWMGRTADRRVRTIAGTRGAHHVAIDEKPARRTAPSTYLAADEWHPNDETYHRWAGRVAALLNLVLVAHATATLDAGADLTPSLG